LKAKIGKEALAKLGLLFDNASTLNSMRDGKQKTLG